MSPLSGPLLPIAYRQIPHSGSPLRKQQFHLVKMDIAQERWLTWCPRYVVGLNSFALRALLCLVAMQRKLGKDDFKSCLQITQGPKPSALHAVS